MTGRLEGRLGQGLLEDLDRQLAGTDELLRVAYPGDRPGRQPVHTVYVPADRYGPTSTGDWGRRAREAAASHGGVAQVCAAVGMDCALIEEVAPRVEAKLTAEPIEDLRIDFEDGYGIRSDEVEDAAALQAARDLATGVERGDAPPFVGLRFKCLEQPTRRRGLRTLDLFLSALLDAGPLPDGLRITLPKVSTVSQVEAMVAFCTAYEDVAGLAAGRLAFEVQVETPQLILAADGRLPLAAALVAGAGRVSGLHYGTYDYSASLGIAAAQQSLAHPAADFAKHLMQVAVAGTGVELSDGSTNVLPVGSPSEVIAAWQLHAGLVRRSLERGYYQGWDLHPAQLVTRFLANVAFYREGFSRAAERLAAYLDRRSAGVLDEPATARALARYLQRGRLCGALDAAEVEAATGLGVSDLDELAQPRPPVGPS